MLHDDVTQKAFVFAREEMGLRISDVPVLLKHQTRNAVLERAVKAVERGLLRSPEDVVSPEFRDHWLVVVATVDGMGKQIDTITLTVDDHTGKVAWLGGL